jgi:tetratricopeptide (TPR) repeat protein
LEAIASFNLAKVYILQGKWSEAGDKLSSSQAVFKEVGTKDIMPEMERSWGRLYLKKGELEKALEHTLRSVEMAKEQEVPHDLGKSFYVLGEIHLERYDYEEAESALVRSLDILSNLRSDYEVARTKTSLARLALKTGRDVDLDRLEEAIGTFERLGAQADLEEALQLKKQI